MLTYDTGPVFIFAYGRVSSEGGGVGGLSRQEASVTLQDRTLRDYLESAFHIPHSALAEALPPERLFLERHSGAFEFGDIRTRPQGARMMAAIERTRADHPGRPIHLLVPKLDRLGRTWLEGQKLLHELIDDLDVSLHIINLGGRTFSVKAGSANDLMSRKILSDLFFHAELEVSMMRDRIKGEMERKRADGELCGTVPYGFDAEETGRTTGKGVAVRRLVDNATEQGWLRHMQAARHDGVSYEKIALELNDQNVPTKRAGLECKGPGGVAFVGGGQWNAAKVRKILLSRTTREWFQRQHELDQAA